MSASSQRPRARYEYSGGAVADEMKALAEKRRQERALLDSRVLALFMGEEELYSVEAAERLRLPKPMAARSILDRLEKAGLLESRILPAPSSGLGRKYFRLRRAA